MTKTNQSWEKIKDCVDNGTTTVTINRVFKSDYNGTIGRDVTDEMFPNWEERFDEEFLKTYKSVAEAFKHQINLKDVKSFIRTELSKAKEEGRQEMRDEVIKMCEEMKGKNKKSIDKLPEKTERDRVYNQLNENMIFGFQYALTALQDKLK